MASGRSSTGGGDGMTFAEKMMKKMGWAEGKGLGKDETGMKDFIKPKMKFNSKGIGFMGVDNKWVAHQEHFDELLISLNKGEKPDQQREIACLTSESKLRGRTKFYSKMMRGKDLSNRSAKDLTAIIVPLSKKDKVEKAETAKLPSELDGTLKSSNVSMNDYFANMIAQRKAKHSGTAGSKSSSSSSNSDSRADSDEIATPTDTRADSVEDSESAPKKKSKIRKRRRSDDSADDERRGIELSSSLSSGDTGDSTETRGRKKLRPIVIDDDIDAEEPTKEQRSKKKKHKRNEMVSAVLEEGSAPAARAEEKVVLPADEDGEHHANSNDEEAPRKKKKKKSKKLKENDDSERSSNGADQAEDHSCVAPLATDLEELTDKKRRKKSRTIASDAAITADRENATVKLGQGSTDADSDGAEVATARRKSKQKRSDSSQDETECPDEWPDDATRLNVKLGLLREIRGPSLGASKAKPVCDITDEQIHEVYRLWTTGAYGEFMRKVHSGELPRWLGMEKRQVDRMLEGRSKTIDLIGLRELLNTKWSQTNLHEIWGYTTLAYVAV